MHHRSPKPLNHLLITQTITYRHYSRPSNPITVPSSVNFMKHWKQSQMSTLCPVVCLIRAGASEYQHKLIRVFIQKGQASHQSVTDIFDASNDGWMTSHVKSLDTRHLTSVSPGCSTRQSSHKVHKIRNFFSPRERKPAPENFHKLWYEIKPQWLT